MINISQVMESMRRQVEYLTLENDRLQKALKDSLSSVDSANGANKNFDEDEDGMERVAQLSTLTLDAQRPSALSHALRKVQETPSLPRKTAMPSAQAAPLLHFTPGSVQPAQDKYSSDFDFSLKPQQQPPIPPPLPIYNGEILQAPYSAPMQKQSSVKDHLQVKSSTAEALPSLPSSSHSGSVVCTDNQESHVHVHTTTIPTPQSSAAPALSMQKVYRQPSFTAATVVPSISVGVVKAAQVSRPPSAGDRTSDRSQNSERSAFSASEANEG